jgi:hypothetical protein
VFFDIRTEFLNIIKASACFKGLNIYTTLLGANIIRMIKLRTMRWVEHIECTVSIINAYTNLVSRPKRKKPLRRPRHRGEENINMTSKEI